MTTMEIAKLVLDYIRVLIWPAVAVAVCLVFKSPLVALLNRIRHAELPGGVAVDLDQDIREVRNLSAKVQEQPAPAEKRQGPGIPLTQANARMIQLGLRPSPSGLDMCYYRNLADRGLEGFARRALGVLYRSWCSASETVGRP